MRFKVIYVEDEKVKRCFMHSKGPKNREGILRAAGWIYKRFAMNPWWGMMLLEIKLDPKLEFASASRWVVPS